MGGLDDRFAQQATLIPLLCPLPTLAEACSVLQMEEQNQQRKANAPRLFHTAARPSAPAPPAPPPAAPTHQPPPGWRPSPNYKGKNPVYRPPKQASATSSSASAPASASPAPPPPQLPSGSDPSTWRPSHDPWTGLVQAWPMPWSAPSPYGAPPAYSGSWAPGLRPPVGAPGLLGARPPPHAYAAYAPLYQAAAAPTAYSLYPYGAPPTASWDAAASSSTAPPSSQSTSSTSTIAAPAWDQAAFIAAMNSLTTQDTGSSHQGGDSSVQ
ncbi:vegetative cell wall protein gp1-like [Triticum aestivum]|uniref:vegetative cell wall protein gp1-like n=1 Tax=Triticum aestivum TaxID=4565 RepID=UPI001D003227|nr:vegetative cell wall protein gp1-like [Triticum aestivum]